jgi:hypothetical protein
MANSHERKPFRPLGLRMLSLSRQIIQNYAATDPIARQLLPRALEEPNYEPLSWDNGDDFEAEADEPQAPEFETYESPYADTEPSRPQKSARPANSPQAAQPPVQRKADNKSAKPPQAPQSNQPAQPTQPAAQPQGANPKKLVDVGGVKVPEHVVQAFRNFQAREAQKTENRQKLSDDASNLDKDSILAKRQQRGRGMSINYVATDTLRGDEGEVSPSPSSDSSSDEDSHPAAQMSNSPPAADAPIMRDMVEDAAEYSDDIAYDYEADTDYGSDETASAEVATMPQSGQPIQRTPDYSAFDEVSDESDSISYQADYDSYSSEMPATDSAPVSNVPTINRKSSKQRPIQRQVDDSDVSPSLYDDFSSDANTADMDTSVSDTPPVSRTSRNAKPIQRQVDSSNTQSDKPAVSRSKRSVQRQADTDAAHTGTPITPANNPIQRQADYEDASTDDLYSDFEAVDTSSDIDTSVSNTPTIKRKTSGKQPIQRQVDYEDTSTDDLYNDFEVDTASSDIDTSVSNTPTINRQIQRQVDYKAASPDDLYSDFEAADTGSDFDAPTINRKTSRKQPIQRQVEYEDSSDSDFEATDTGSDIDTPVSNTPTINRKTSGKQPIQRQADYVDSSNSDFEATDTGSDIDTSVSNTPTINRKTSRKQPIQRQVEYEDSSDNDFEATDTGSDIDTSVSNAPTINRKTSGKQSIQRQADDEDTGASDLYSDFEAADTGSEVDAPVINRKRNSKASVQREADSDNSFYRDFSEEVTPPLSGPVIEEDYYDFSLQTDRMRAITNDDIAAYDARQPQASTPNTNAPIQRSTDDDSDYSYDNADYGYDVADSGDTGQPDIHQALFAAGAVDTPPSTRQPRIQRSSSLYDDLAAERGYSDTGQVDAYATDAVDTSPDRPTRGKVQRRASLYDDLAPSDADAVYNTGDSGAADIQRTADDETSIGTGNLKADLLSLIGLPPNTHVEGFSDVFGGGKKSDANASADTNSNSQPIQRQMIERSADPAPTYIQREETSSTSSTTTSSSSTSSESNPNQDEKTKIEQVAQEVYQNIKKRLRVEWERRNRF